MQKGGIMNNKPKHNLQAPDVTDGYMRKEAAVKYLGISVRTLSAWMSRRMIPYMKMSHRVCLFSKTDLDKAMARYRINAIGEDW